MFKIKEEFLLKQSKAKTLSEETKSVRIDLSLKHNPYINTGRITGRVQDETGKPIVNANVILFNENYEITANTLSESNGIYVINTVEANTYIAYAKATGYRMSEPVRLSIKANETLEMDLRLHKETDESLGIIAGTVMNTDNLPIATAAAELYKKEDSGQKPVTIAFSNEIGRFSMSRLSTGSYLLKINAQGYFSDYCSLDIKQPNEILPVTITLKKNPQASRGIITGIITNEEDQPIADADVVLFRIESDGDKTPVAYTRTNKEGIYMFVNLPQGAYCINSDKTIIIS